MSVSVTAENKSFASLREHLFDQFVSPDYDRASGVDVPELETLVREFIHTHPTMPRVLQKANAFRIVVTRGRICVDPVDWFVDKLDHGDILRMLTKTWLDEAIGGEIQDEAALLENAYEIGLLKGPRGGLDLGHISPGWDHMLRAGLDGLLNEIVQSRASSGITDQSQLDFLAAVEMVYRAIIKLSHRFADLCESMISEFPDSYKRLTLLARTCRVVPSGRPETFQEALQFTWLMHQVIEMEGEFVRSMGQFDRSLYPFYQADIESGRITREHAKELIKFYWMKWYSRTRGAKNGKNFVFGGQQGDGELITNDLTYLALEAYEELGTPDPKLSVRFNPGEDCRLYRRVADLIRKGHNSFVLINDPVAICALERMGKTPEDARNYLPIGCYEPAVEGREAACTMNVTVNLAKIVELTLHDGFDPVSNRQFAVLQPHKLPFASFEELQAQFFRNLDTTLELAHRCISAAEGIWPSVNPSPCIAGTIEDCILSGMDVGQGGPRYNSVGFVGAGLANAADSLMAIKQAVFVEQRYTFDEVVSALRQNYDGHPGMREYLISGIPKWGNDSSEVDSIGRDIASRFTTKVHQFTNRRGGRCQAALFTLDYAWRGGLLTGALPDGKRAADSLAPGTGASYGRDLNGVTSLLNSVLNINAGELPNGSVLDVTLHPTAVAGATGLEALVNLIQSYFERGGYALQFNVYDTKTLRDAQINPERYKTLQVRLTGWSVYFTSLSAFEQEQFIKRLSHAS